MKQRNLMAVLSVMFAATLMMSSTSQAADKAPGEGYYVGAFMGFGMGILQADVNAQTINSGSTVKSQTYETDRGGLGLSGVQGGLWAGWGMKTADDLYFGAEISAIGSDEKIKLTASGTGSGINTGNGSTITEASAQRTWGGGGAVRVGYYVNSDTLFTVKAGVAVSAFDVDIQVSNETYYAGGPQFGTSVETRLSKIDPNLSLRLEAVYTDYLTADILDLNGLEGGGGHDTELTGHDIAARIGVQYSF
jgi:hypothetical protein